MPSFTKALITSTMLALVASSPVPQSALQTCTPAPVTSINTVNTIVDKIPPCKALNVIFAKGTCGAGNLGDDIGPSFVADVQAALGEELVAVQGVNYDATWADAFAGGSDDGASYMAWLVTDVLQLCPDTKIVLAGYSQGAQVVHKAATQLTAYTDKISSVIVFGDPDNGQAVGTIATGLVGNFCASGDDVCTIGLQWEVSQEHYITAAHSSYETNGDTQLAANFVKAHSGLV